MKQSPFPVSPDNFPQCWESIDSLRRKARRKAVISGIGGFWSNLVLLFCLLFAAHGVIFEHLQGSYCDYLATLPWFLKAWDFVSGLLLKAGDSLQIQVLKLVLASYGAAIAVFVLLTLLVVLFYHPRKKPVPEGAYPEQTAKLAEISREARARSYKTRLSTSLASVLLVIVAEVGVFMGYAVFRNDAVAVAAVLSKFPTASYETNCLIYVLAAYFIFGIFCWVLLQLTRPLYRYDFPYDYVVQAETAAIFSLEEDTEITPEQRLAKAAALREEAMGLELEHAYSKAKFMYSKAALCGDVPAMEHYARHCLLDHMNDSARYWLERCTASEQASKEAKSMLLRMKLKMKHNVRYLQPEAPPLTKGQKFLHTAGIILTVLWRILIVALLVLVMAAAIVLVKSDMDIGIFSDLSEAVRVLFG